jgi:ABC-2 type transport system permease protein
VATVTTAAVVLLVFLTATVLRRGAAAVAVFMLVVLVLPIAVSVLTVVGPVPLRGPADVLLAVLPGTLALKALSTATIGADGPMTVVTGLLGLVAWCGAAGALAVRAFAREGDG